MIFMPETLPGVVLMEYMPQIYIYSVILTHFEYVFTK
jgi:hypothetical protein